MRAPVYPPPAEPKKKRRRKSLLLTFLGWSFGLFVVAFVAVSAAVGWLLFEASKDLPDYESLARYEPPVMTRIHAHDGSLIAEYARERRIFVPINTIPKRVIAAFLSAEDARFYDHGGIDMQGVARAAIKYIETKATGRGSIQGASTITQQVAKNFLLTSDRTFDRKIKEAILAIRIERAYSKDKILELYLNEIYLGIGAYGVAAASLNYFNKELKDLTLEEAAYLAALPKAPNNYHPFRNRQKATERRNWILEQMAENGFIKDAEATEAKAKPLEVKFRQSGAHIFAAEYFAEEVRRSLHAQYGEEKLYAGGLLGSHDSQPAPPGNGTPVTHRRPCVLRSRPGLARPRVKNRHFGRLGRAARRDRHSVGHSALAVRRCSPGRQGQGSRGPAPVAATGWNAHQGSRSGRNHARRG